MMELWIRSQDKKILCKCNDICVSAHKKNKYIEYYDKASFDIIGYFDKNTEYEILGNYETQFRALKILDEIQNILKLKDMYKYDRESVLKSWENIDEEQVKIVRQQMSVYEMPKD